MVTDHDLYTIVLPAAFGGLLFWACAVRCHLQHMYGASVMCLNTKQRLNKHRARNIWSSILLCVIVFSAIGLRSYGGLPAKHNGHNELTLVEVSCFSLSLASPPTHLLFLVQLSSCTSPTYCILHISAYLTTLLADSAHYCTRVAA